MSNQNLKNIASELVAQMTDKEKVLLCSGKNFWQTKGIARLGLSEQMLTDGPHGLRKQTGTSDHLGINNSVPAVCFPTASATACSFDPELLTEMGEALGEKCIRENVSVILGPGVNLKRNPLCGRNFEYFSEDPLLSGKLGAALVNGIQSKGIGASVKHFAANNQEHNRMSNDSVIDERCLRELYLAPFEYIVKQASPWTVMSSYNKINGTYASDNRQLLTDILRGEWGFDGMVVTDWGGNNDRINSVAAGNDLEMPNSGEENAKRILRAIKKGKLSIEALDTCAKRITEMILKAQVPKPSCSRTDATDHLLAQKVAAESMVLLKNDKILPLSKDAKIAFLGTMAKSPRYQGAGSSKICPTEQNNAYEAATYAGYSITYADGYSMNEDQSTADELEAAVSVASAADVAVVFAGLPDSYESEGFDRDNMKMPDSHIRLIEAVANANPNTVVVLQCGSPIELPWNTKVKGILLSYLSGQAGGSAVVDLLWGNQNPCGKLAETWPTSYADTPSAKDYPADGLTAEYRESLLIGYRYYDALHMDVKYPFGYGLSYTSFAYQSLSVCETGENTFDVSVTVRNTGTVSGKEIIELYLEFPSSTLFRAPKQLTDFTKIQLAPSEEKTVVFHLTPENFRYYNVKAHAFCIESGTCILHAGTSSRDLPLFANICVHGDGKEKLLLSDMEQLTEYLRPTAPFAPSDEQFSKLLGRPLPPRKRDSKQPFTASSTFSDIKDTAIGKAMLARLNKKLGVMAAENTDESSKRMATEMVASMPLRSMAMTGALTLRQIDGLVAMANKHYLRGIILMIH